MYSWQMLEGEEEADEGLTCKLVDHTHQLLFGKGNHQAIKWHDSKRYGIEHRLWSHECCCRLS